jgi:cytidine deaminase
VSDEEALRLAAELLAREAASSEPDPYAPKGAKPTDRDGDLVECAVRVRGHAYAPYSKFAVGAAVRMDGQVFEGVNVENASYPMCVCAERNAIAAAVSAGARRLSAVAVCTQSSPPSSPCGGCRQVLVEFAEDPAAVRVIAVNPQGERREWTLAQLLPDNFHARELPPT